MSNVSVIIKMCYVHNQWYDISCATLYLVFSCNNIICQKSQYVMPCACDWTKLASLVLVEGFAKLRKATNSFVMSFRPSLRLYRITRLLLDGFSWNLVQYLRFFRNSVKKMHVSLKSDKNKWYFTWRPIYIFDNISLISY